MSAAPFGDGPPEDRSWESELARLRREMPQFGFLFDGRYWWGVYGRLVAIHASDPETLKKGLREAVRETRERP